MANTPSTPKSQTMGLLIALAVLNMVGFLVLYFKADIDASLTSMNAGFLSQQLARVETKVSGVQTEQPVTSVKSEVSDAIDPSIFPVVVFTPEGLLKNEPQERTYLQEKIVAPIKDYYNANGLDVVSVKIDIPQVKGQQYDVTIIRKVGNSVEAFGKRGDTSAYWLPSCMDVNDCGITSEFKAKYPELMKQLGQ